LVMLRLVRFDDALTGLVLDETAGSQIIDLGASLEAVPGTAATQLEPFVAPGGSWVGLIERWQELSAPLEALQHRAAGGAGGVVIKSPSTVRLLAPLPEPGARVFAMGGNFSSHEAGRQRD
jgi:hypothetical protein